MAAPPLAHHARYEDRARDRGGESTVPEYAGGIRGRLLHDEPLVNVAQFNSGQRDLINVNPLDRAQDPAPPALNRYRLCRAERLVHDYHAPPADPSAQTREAPVRRNAQPRILAFRDQSPSEPGFDARDEIDYRDYRRALVQAAADIRDPAVKHGSVPKSLDEPCYVCYGHFDGPESALWCIAISAVLSVTRLIYLRDNSMTILSRLLNEFCLQNLNISIVRIW